MRNRSSKLQEDLDSLQKRKTQLEFEVVKKNTLDNNSRKFTKNLLGDVSVSSGIIGYLSPFISSLHDEPIHGEKYSLAETFDKPIQIQVYLPFKVFIIKKNDGVWAVEGEEIEPDLIHAKTDKFQKGIVFWGAVSAQGLIPLQAPMNVTKWLEQQRTLCNDKRKRKYLTNKVYAKFLQEKAAPAIKAVFRKTKLDPIFQDDQDRKQRTTLVRKTVDQLFSERIKPVDGDTKFADVWRIENVWGALKEKIRGKVFATSIETEKETEKEWKK
ncbi:unnamed protein product [Rotaria sordida]|uniref:Uncharacterized protein n=1 Tax=Rotaria sordida TaxID=392033 RepID=A0A814VXD5_9BILA|nr:unnamed protein product [Rotaria sordida]CAF1199465.1 unnamed protein product [Rotaria sordida]CAF1462942.1 unnamed protein product [Rotaria sordida]CAF4063277.1 unnamed protein product [Rotaria sordida]